MAFRNLVILLILVLLGVAGYLLFRAESGLRPGEACTMEALVCPDGSSVGRVPPSCDFAPCPEPPEEEEEPTDQPAAYKDLIRITAPAPESTVASPLTVRGEARGSWFFEGSFPVVLTDWDGRIIAQTQAKAEGEWMTEGYVPFTARLDFSADTSVSNRGALILRKDNPSGLPENDDAFEVTLFFEQ